MNQKDMMRQRQNRVLVSVVDAAASSRESTCWLIRSYGFEVEAFDCAQEFLASPEKDRTACLILDLCLPGGSGLELQQRLTKENARIPIIFITAYADDDEERKAMIGGAVALFANPK